MLPQKAGTGRPFAASMEARVAIAMQLRLLSRSMEPTWRRVGVLVCTHKAH
jgi:hypothetical protein